MAPNNPAYQHQSLCRATETAMQHRTANRAVNVTIPECHRARNGSGVGTMLIMANGSECGRVGSDSGKMVETSGLPSFRCTLYTLLCRLALLHRMGKLLAINNATFVCSRIA